MRVLKFSDKLRMTLKFRGISNNNNDNNPNNKKNIEN